MMRNRRGFTLVELLVALSIGAAVVLMAHRITSAVLESSGWTERARLAADREANARRVLTTLVGSVDVVTRHADEFRGEPHRVAFTAWCDDEYGWPIRRRVMIEATEGDLTVSGWSDQRVRLLSDVSNFDVDYLLAYGAREQWVGTWISSASAPEALRFRIARTARVDTLLLLIGARG
jgi:prepilin-type N-terminal cleavage/methylation domain-containing protein